MDKSKLIFTHMFNIVFGTYPTPKDFDEIEIDLDIDERSLKYLKYKLIFDFNDDDFWNLKINELNIQKHDCNFFMFSDNVFKTPLFTENDLNRMSESECSQYVLYKNIEYMLRLKNGIVLQGSSDKYDFEKIFDCEIVLNLKDIDQCYWHLLPRFCKYHIIIDEPILFKFSNNVICICDKHVNYHDNVRFFTTNYDLASKYSHYILMSDINIIKCINKSELLFHSFVSKYYKKHKCILETPDFNGDNCVILVDNRPNIMSILALSITMYNLDDTWEYIVYTSSDSIDFYCKYIDKKRIRVHEELNKKFSIKSYNKIFMSQEFWEELEKYNRVLVIQDDGFLIRKGIDEFLDYDYVGAPWAFNNELKQYTDVLVGNGGFSLRNPRIMKDICQKYVLEKNTLFFNNIILIPEDVYFCSYIKNKPSEEKASYFSSEQILNSDSLGFHKPWAYHSYSKLVNFFNIII